MIFNDQEQISNIYASMLTEARESPIQEAKKKAKPDYLDVDGDGNTKEPLKKALKDKAMKESSNFKELFNRVISEATVCGCSITKGAQYDCVTKDGKEKVLKGESVLMMKDKLKSVKAAHKK